MANLVGQKGYRKVENYMRKVVLADYWIRTNPSTTPEEIEQLNLKQERRREENAAFHIVERVIAHRDLDTGRQYMVKCVHLPSFLTFHFADGFQGND